MRGREDRPAGRVAAGEFYSGSTAFGKANSRLDPGGAYVATGQKDKLDPANLNNAPDQIPVPPALQDAKEPDTMAARRNARQPYRNNGTLLTGPSGITNGSLNTGGATLLRG